MTRKPDGWERRRPSRGQTAVLGFVLLIGVVSVTSVGILLVAGETTSELQQRSENDRVEGAFVELSRAMATTSSSNDVSRSIDLSVGERGAVAKENTGRITIESDGIEMEDGSNSIPLPIGTIEYTGDDGTTVAYQAGGVFRERGNETQVVSAPPIHYDSGSETFTFPVVTITGEETLGSGDISIDHDTTTSYEEATVVTDASVTITVESDYYRGWEEYFTHQAGGAVVRDVDHENRTVEVRLGHLELEEAFDNGVTVSEGGFGTQGNPDYDDEEIQSGTLPSFDEAIDGIIDDSAGNSSIQAGKTYQAGTYLNTSDVVFDGGETTTFDLQNGNATLAVDGDLEIDGRIEVTNASEGTALKIYTAGNVSLGQLCVDVCDPDGGTVDAEHLQLYTKSTSAFEVGWGSDNYFEGVFYGPGGDDATFEHHSNNCGNNQVCVHSNGRIDGSVVASSAYLSSNAEFEYDDDLRHADIDPHPENYPLPPQLTYLNVAHHEVDVRNG